MSSVTLILMRRIGFKTVLGEKKLLLVDLGLKSDIEMTRVWMFGGGGGDTIFSNCGSSITPRMTKLGRGENNKISLFVLSALSARFP